MRHSIEEARQHYAEELRFTAKLGSRVVIDAFATVPREHFFGPGPWRVLSPMALGEYWSTEDADPRHLAVSLVAAHQGGALVTFLTDDPEPLRAALTGAVEYVRSFAAAPKRRRSGTRKQTG